MKISIFFLMMLILSTMAFAQEKLIISGHPDYPPIMWNANQTIIGVGPEIAGIIFSELGVEFEIRFTGPWQRVQENARTGEIDFIVGLYMNDERKTYMDYTEPYMTDPTSIFVMKNNIFNFQKWEDLIGKTGTTIHGESFGDELDRFIQTKLSMHKVYDANTIFKLVESGRVDYMIWGYYPFLVNALKNGYNEKIVPLPHNAVVENMYMAFSKKSKYLYLIPEVNRKIHKIKSEGHLDNLVKKYIDHLGNNATIQINHTN